MTVELGKRPPRPIDFTLFGQRLAAKPLPFRLFMRLAAVGDGEVPVELMSEMMVETVVFEKSGDPVFASTDEVLEWDGPQLVKLFTEVTAGVAKHEDAVKN